MGSAARLRRIISRGPMVLCNRSGVYYQMIEMIPDLEKPGFVRRNLGTFLLPTMDTGRKFWRGKIRP